MKVSKLIKEIKKTNCKSYWQKGLKAYAIEMVRDIEYKKEISYRFAETDLLNGAQSWLEYSEGGCSLVCHKDIAKRLCTPSELKRMTRIDGSLKDRPNARETWLECQSRALFQACELIKNIIRNVY